MLGCAFLRITEYCTGSGDCIPNFNINKALALKENYAIRIISLNDVIDANIFALKGMQIPVGTHVMLLPESLKDNYFWDGNEIQSERGMVLNNRSDQKRYTFIRALLIVVGLGMICAGCISKYLQFRKKDN